MMFTRPFIPHVKWLMLLTVLLLSRSLFAGVAITPAYVEVTLDKGRPTGEFVVTNNGDATERYRVNALNFKFSKGGGIQRMEVDDNSLASWIIFNPKEFDLPAKSKRSIRFVIAPKGTPRPGEFVAGMELESLNTTTGSGKDAAGHEMKIMVIPSILVPVFAQVGKIEYKAEIKEASLAVLNNILTVQSLINNTGNARLLITGDYELIDSAGKTISSGPLPKCYILRESDRLMITEIKEPVPDGTYTIKTKISSPQLGDKPLTQETTVQWKKPATTAPANATVAPTTAPATAPASAPPAPTKAPPTP